MPDTPVDRTSPLWLAWVAYQTSRDYANTARCAVHPEHTKGSLWAAFASGFAAAQTARRDEMPFDG